METDADFDRWAEHLLSEMNVKRDPLRREVAIKILRQVFGFGVDAGKAAQAVLELHARDRFLEGLKNKTK